MADKGIASVTASVFMDDIKAAMGGNSSYEPKDANDKWIFAEIAVGNSNGNLIAALDFLGSVTSITTSDVVQWIAIKNISTTSTDGIVISTEAGTAAWNLAGGIALGAGEMIVLKGTTATTVDHIHAISVTMDGTYGYPTGTHSGTVAVQVAAILDDVA
tara:strand:+ start:2085 stop:2561 length:477 start_codon:yes stop_codon:yes gene_type:complete